MKSILSNYCIFFIILLSFGGLFGCGDNSVTVVPLENPQVTQNITQAGGSITVGEGRVDFPANSVTGDVTATGNIVTNINSPAGVTAVSSIYEFTLSNGNLYNADSATITLPTGGNTGVSIYRSADGTSWTNIGGTISGNNVSAPVPGFSYFLSGKISGEETPTPDPTAGPQVNIIWEKVNSPTDENLNDSCFADANTAFIVGDNRTVLKTVDGGDTWEINMEAPPDPKQTIDWEDIYGVSFSDPNNGVIVGERGFIMYTEDGGEVWNVPDPNSTEKLSSSIDLSTNINSVFAASLDLIIAVGNSGVIIKSTDRGKTWTQVDSGTTKNLNSVVADIRANHPSVAVGDDGTIVTTLGHDRIWDVVDSGTTKTLIALHVGDTQIFTAAGYDGTILKGTIDE